MQGLPVKSWDFLFMFFRGMVVFISISQNQLLAIFWPIAVFSLSQFSAVNCYPKTQGQDTVVEYTAVHQLDHHT